MPLISFSGVSAEFGAETIFSDVTFALERRQRLGIVGPNGAGKSTLLKIAMGELEAAQGKVERERRLRIGRLDQFDTEFTAESVLEQTMSAQGELLEMRHRLHQLEQRMSAGDHGEATMRAYGEVQEAYDHGGGYTLEARCREVLGGLGFLDEMLDRDPRHLSGGQRRRVQLAQMLLVDSDVLVLDEPTNHLDLASIEWLEEYLNSSPQAMLVVSHDRRLLDNVAESMMELEQGSAYVYPGNYTKFVGLRADRRADQMRRFEAQQEFINHQEAFIQRYKAGQRAREARGRATRLERLERVEAPPDDKAMHIKFGGPPSAGVPLQSQGLLAGYPDHPLVQVPRFTVNAGDRIAIVGPNGAGKTTLLKTLQGNLKPLDGGVAYGARVSVSYYDQHLGDLPAEKDMIEVLSDVHPVSEGTARHHLARLLFRGDDVFKKVRQLSGGERSRLALARLMLDQSNLLFLDEPTNHLDVPSQEVLQEALLRFTGTIVFVSHDRELIDNLATHTWWLEEGRITIHDGGYGRRPRLVATAAPHGHSAPPSEPKHELRGRAAVVGSASAAQPRRVGAEVRAQAAAERKARSDAKKRVDAAERAVAAAEAEIKTMEARLADPDLYRFPLEAELLGKRHATATVRLAELYAEWERVMAAAGEGAQAGAPAGE
ncbi:MAG: ABC-F family ATP-binding cassette domain-containing protein [Candidatus Dormibacteria bacterium]